MDLSAYTAKINAAKALMAKGHGGALSTARAGVGEATRLFGAAKRQVSEALQRQSGGGKRDGR